MGSRGQRHSADGDRGAPFLPPLNPAVPARSFEIVFCDLRQWVPTPDGFDVSTITRETFSEDIDAVRRAAGFDRPIVAGQSQHGALALTYAQRFPEHVRGVAAVAPVPPSRSGERFEARDAFFRRDADAEWLAAHERNQADRWAAVERVQDFIDAYVADSTGRPVRRGFLLGGGPVRSR